MRAERLIAFGRAALAATALLSVWSDPTQLRADPAALFSALGAYLAFSLALGLYLLRRPAVPRWLPLVTHTGDLLAFAPLFYATGGPGSPAFLFWIFTVLTGGLRWQWRGALLTAAFLLCVYLVVGRYSAGVLEAWDMDDRRFLIRGAFLVVMSVLVGALGSYEMRLRREMLLLALWPREVPRDPERVLRDSLAHVADALRTRRVIAVWEPGDEPFRHVACWDRRHFEQSAEPPDQWEPLVAPALDRSTFLCTEVGAAAPLVLRVAGGLRVKALRLQPLHEEFRRRFGIGQVISAPIQGQSLRGRLFWIDKPDATADDLVLADILAAQVTARIDRVHVYEVLREKAAADERVRIARDLHDGLLQSLSAAGLQIEAARSLLDGRAPREAEKLARVQQAIASEQRDLRAFIRHLKPRGGEAPDTAPAPEADLKNRLRELARKIEQLWGVRIEVRTEGLEQPLMPSLARHAFLMVNEAVANAVRHGAATAVKVQVGVLADQLRISVSDDGTGFTVAGGSRAPESLAQRVAQLGGSLNVDSTEDGARLQITLPIETMGR